MDTFIDFAVIFFACTLAEIVVDWLNEFKRRGKGKKRLKDGKGRH